MIPLDLQQLSKEIALLILPYTDEISAVRFDALMYAIELGYVAGNVYRRGIKDLKGKVSAVAKVGTIPAVQVQKHQQGRYCYIIDIMFGIW